MEKKIKAVFFDIDGTLVSEKRARLEGKTLAALQEARKNGVLLFIATGRHQTELGLFQNFAFDGYVTLNGQYCYAGETILHANPLPQEDVAAVVRQLQGAPYGAVFAEADRMYANEITGNIRHALGEVNIPLPAVADISRALEHPVFQYIPYVDESQEALVQEAMPNCSYTRWNRFSINVTPKAGDKCVGIEKVLSYFGLQRDEAMALGDGDNDAGMLAYAGVGVAMKNGSAAAKAAADYVTDDVDDDGLFQALVHFGVI